MTPIEVMAKAASDEALCWEIRSDSGGGAHRLHRLGKAVGEIFYHLEEASLSLANTRSTEGMRAALLALAEVELPERAVQAARDERVSYDDDDSDGAYRAEFRAMLRAIAEKPDAD
jgi:hypothetical protein